MKPLFIIAFIFILVLGWFKLLDWLEKRTKKEAAKRAEDYKACARNNQ